MANPVIATKRGKSPGPEPKRLKIEEDPSDALKKLLNTPPPVPEDDEGSTDEETRGD